MWRRREPGTRACLLRRTTVGEKVPDLTEEQGETVRLGEKGEKREEGSGDSGGRAHQLRPQPVSPSQPSDRMDSLEEPGVGYRSGEGLLLSDSRAVFRP